MNGLNLATQFDFSVQRFPNRLALIQGDKKYTYEDLYKEVGRMASSLQRLGVSKNDRVLVLLKNRVETVILFWAIQKLGAIFTPVNIRLSVEDIQYCVNDVEAKYIIFEKICAPAVSWKNFKERPILIGLHEDNVDITYQELRKFGVADSFYPTKIDDNDLSVILYTSGTTGKPKGVPRSHQNEYESTVAHILQSYYQMFENTLGAMPLHHTMGIRSLLSMNILNGTYIAVPDFDPSECADIIKKEKVSCLYLTPTMYHDLVHHASINKMEFPKLNSLVYAGSPMTNDLVYQCNKIFRPKYFVNHYGSTEIYTFTTYSNVREKPGCAGKPGIHQRIRLVIPDPERSVSPDQEVKKGEVGEIIVDMQSSEAFRGYWNRPDATRKAIKDGWYFTGDLGKIDEDGDLYVVGRIDEMILSGGENIHPQQIECVLKEHPKVLDVVVTGEEDKRWGQLVVAFVVYKDKITAQELDRFCKQHKKLPNYMRPRKYIFINEIPRNNSGKVDYHNLRKYKEPLI